MRILALDFETSGTDPRRHAPIQLGLAVMEGGEVIESRQWLVKPITNKAGKIVREYDLVAMSISGITFEQLMAEGMNELEIWNQATHFCRKMGASAAHLVSHNAAFDAAFLSDMQYRQGSWKYGTFEQAPVLNWGPWWCTSRMAQEHLSVANYKLDTCAAHFGLARSSDKHDAEEDAILCGRLFYAIRNLKMAIPA